MKSEDQLLLEEAYQEVLSVTSNKNSELNDIKNWRKNLRQLPEHLDVQKKIDYARSMSVKAFSKLYRFHVLEYKLHLLHTEFVSVHGADRLINFTEYELSEYFNWLKEWMLGILETRMYSSVGDEEIDKSNEIWAQKMLNNHVIKQRDRVPGTKIKKGVPIVSIIDSYKRLSYASNLKEKILAITLSLNAWHDNGGIFGISTRIADYVQDEGAVWYFAPLSIEQFDRLDNIDTGPIKKEIRKDLDL